MRAEAPGGVNGAITIGTGGGVISGRLLYNWGTANVAILSYHVQELIVPVGAVSLSCAFSHFERHVLPAFFSGYSSSQYRPLESPDAPGSCNYCHGSYTTGRRLLGATVLSFADRVSYPAWAYLRLSGKGERVAFPPLAPRF